MKPWSRCVIAVLPDRRKTTFEAWLLQLSPEERRAIKTVSMDMWEAYRQAVQHCLPHAEIVADRFHVMKQLNHKLDLLRRSLQRQAKQNGDELLYQALKGNCTGVTQDFTDAVSTQQISNHSIRNQTIITRMFSAPTRPATWSLSCGE